MPRNTSYPYTPYRIEYRPTFGPPTKDEFLAILDVLAETGVKAWWTSVAAKGSYPMFPSKYLPYRDDAVDYFPWLVEQAHQRDIALFSWEYLTTAPLVGEQHPNWRWKFFDWDGPKVLRDKHYVCWNSPYGELLKQYCVEVVGELGLDGIWFDGSFMHGHGASGRFACCCDFCREKYRKQTGKNLPGTIDLRDEETRRYMEWRYSDHTEYWRSLSGYVRQHIPEAIIVFNYFNRLGANNISGSPLRRMAADAPQWPDTQPHGPMEGMISAEIDARSQQTMLLTKILRAINDNYPVELWSYAVDTLDIRCWKSGTDNPAPEPMLVHAGLTATAGGFPSFGADGENFEGFRSTFKVLTQNLAPIAPYQGGEPITTVGLVVSGCTKDYGFVDNDHPQGLPLDTWNAVHGMHNMLNSLHMPSEVLLDNMINEPFLNKYQAVVLPAVRCLSKSSAEALTSYVEAGGTVLAIGLNGVMDELGRPYDKPMLDELFDITWRDEAFSRIDLEFASDIADGIPPSYKLPGESRLVRCGSGEVLATGKYNVAAKERVFTSQGIQRPAQDIIEGVAVIRRKVGKGQAILIVPDIAMEFGQCGTNLVARRLIGALLGHIVQPFTAEAPPNVAFGMYKKDGLIVLHTMNVPSELRVLGLREGHHNSPLQLMPQDVIPVGPVRVTVPGTWKKVFCPSPNVQPTMKTTTNEAVIEIDYLAGHAMIVLEQ